MVSTEFMKNLDAAKPPEQSKVLGGNIIGAKGKSSRWY